MDVFDGEAAAAVVPVPNHHFGGAGRDRAFHRGIQLARQQVPRFVIPALPRQKLLVGVIDAADAFHIRDNENPRASECSAGQQQKQDQLQTHHGLSCNQVSIMEVNRALAFLCPAPLSAGKRAGFVVLDETCSRRRQCT